MKPVLFELFGEKIYSWSFMVVVGVIFLAMVYFYRMKKLNVSEKALDRLIIITAIGGLFTYLGASFFDTLWHCISNAMVDGKFVLENFKLDFNVGGVTFEGGIVTGITAFFILYPLGMKTDKYRALTYMDQIVIGILIAHAFGRIGCFLGGCCYGKHTDSFLGMYYPDAGTTVYPTQLYEAVFLFICFIIFFFFTKKNHTEKYLISYGTFRFFLEYLRGDDRGASPFGFLTPSQFLSLVMIIGGIVCIFVRKKLYEKELSMQKDNEEKVKLVRYYTCSYKGLFKGLFKKCNCPKCNTKMKLKLESILKEENEIELTNHEHLIYKCTTCEEKQEIN